jgi:hypothetical protein
VCDHWYPTKTCGRSNPAVRSSWDNETSLSPSGRASREGIPTTASVTAVGGQGGWQGSLRGTADQRRENQQAKGADRLGPKGKWPRAGVSPFPGRRCRATGGQAEPQPSVIRPQDVVSPSSSPRGRPAARWTDGMAGRG